MRAETEKLPGEATLEGRPVRLAFLRSGRMLFGIALLAAVIVVTLHWTEGEHFVEMLEQAAPAWLLVAALLQAATYWCQGEVWKVVLDRADERVRGLDLYTMSVAKLLVDQALPSAGVSGTLLIVRGLARRGVTRGPIMACVVVETITNFTAFVAALSLAIGLAAWLEHLQRAVWVVSGALTAVVAVLIAAVVWLSRGHRPNLPKWAARIPGVKTLLTALADAPPGLAHRPVILLEGTALNFAIHLLDAATLWALLQSVGVSAPPTDVFAAFMISTLARTIGVVPGGLGTFEGAMIAGLGLMHVPLEAALAAALLFRGFSFWLPMAPGLWFSRVELRAQRSARPAVHRLRNASR